MKYTHNEQTLIVLVSKFLYHLSTIIDGIIESFVNKLLIFSMVYGV